MELGTTLFDRIIIICGHYGYVTWANKALRGVIKTRETSPFPKSDWNFFLFFLAFIPI